MKSMTTEDNAIYASRSGLVLMAANPATRAVDETLTAARAADKALASSLTFVEAVRQRIESYEDEGANCLSAIY